MTKNMENLNNPGLTGKNRIYLVVAIAILIIIAIAIGIFWTTSSQNKPTANCGDNVCQLNENVRTCPRDCLIKNNNQQSLCGDGICSILETNSDTCSQDCDQDKPKEKITPDDPQATKNQLTNNQLFAWAGGTIDLSNDTKYISDLGIVNADTNALWDGPKGSAIETEKGRYDFSYLDVAIKELKNAGINNTCLAINPSNKLYDIQHGVMTNSSQWQAYNNFLEALIAHYPSVNCWQIVRELNEEKFSGTPERYAELISFSSKIIRKINPQAIIVFGALPYELREQTHRENFLKDVLAKTNDFDAIDIHLHQGLSKETGVKMVEEAVNYYKAQLTGSKKIFFETSSYSGQPKGYLEQTEQDQADDLIARLNKLKELGVDRINLEGGLYQRFYFLFVGGKPTGHLEYFEHNALVWNCAIDDETDDNNCISGNKKKSYYALKTWLTE